MDCFAHRNQRAAHRRARLSAERDRDNRYGRGVEWGVAYYRARDGKEVSKTIKIAEMPEAKMLASADTNLNDKEGNGKKEVAFSC